MEDCLFCKIVSNEIPSYKVYEDEYVLAFLDIHPCSKGHTVVVPKKHFANLWEMEDKDFGFLMTGVRAASKKVQEKLKPEGMNIGLNNEKAAGQSVGHTHFHILPRWEGDGGGSLHSIIHNDGGADVKEVAKLFL